jgi:hypothetical protein
MRLSTPEGRASNVEFLTGKKAGKKQERPGVKPF